MYAEQIPLNKPLSTEYTHELEKRIFFISDDIIRFDLVIQGDFIQAIDVTVSKLSTSSELAKKINTVIENDIIKQVILPPHVMWRSSKATKPYHLDIFEFLLEKNLIFEMGEGQVCFSEPLIKLMDYFDAKLKEIAVSLLHAEEYRYPTLIPSTALQKCGYFDSFPHFLMFVTRLHNDIDNYQAFLSEYEARKELGTYLFAHCENLDYCLPPTMCYHTYHHLKNNRFSRGEHRVITSKGKSFRFESKYHRTLERLWDFTIREIVFLGDRDFVLDCRQTFMKAAIDFVEEMGLVGYCEVANDPFFCGQDTATKIFSQRMLELKYELRLNITPDTSIAVGSFNFHDEFFGERFSIRQDDDAWVQTGCVGFGLERFVYAFLCQYGFDETQWPQLISRALERDAFVEKNGSGS